MCRTMKELERVVADYRSMKAMKEQIDAEVKSLEYEIIGYMDANEKPSSAVNIMFRSSSSFIGAATVRLGTVPK